MEETERFVDESENQIPTRDTWDTLTVNQLIDVRNQLEDKLFDFRSQATIARVLTESIDHINKMIQERSIS